GTRFPVCWCYYPSQSLNRAAVPGRPRDLWERAVKRELYQVRVLPFVVSSFLVVWALLCVIPARTPAQNPAPPETSSEKPKSDKPKDDTTAQSPEAQRDAKAQEDKKDQAQDPSPAIKDDVKKNTKG